MLAGLPIWLRLGLAIVAKILGRAAKITWEDVWQQAYQAVISAEEKYRNGYGAKKKQEVIDYVVSFVQGHTKLNALEMWVVRMIIGKFVDGLVMSVNDQLGNSWLDEAEQIKLDIEHVVPFLAGDDTPPPADPNVNMVNAPIGSPPAAQSAAVTTPTSAAKATSQ